MNKILGFTAIALASAAMSANATTEFQGTAGTTSTFDFQKEATVNIQVPQLDITEDANAENGGTMNFGTIIKPANGDEVTLTIDEDGNVVGGTATFVNDGSQSGAQFIVSGGSQLVSLNVVGGAPVNGLSLVGFNGSYDNSALTDGQTINATGLSAPGNGVNLLLGGTLSVDNSNGDVLVQDNQTIPYTVTFTYE